MRTPLLVLGCLCALLVVSPGCVAEAEADSAASALQAVIDDPHSTPEQRAAAQRSLTEFNALKVSADKEGAKDQALVDRVVSAVGGTGPAVGIIAAIGGGLWQGIKRDSWFRTWLGKLKPAAVTA